MQTINYDSRGRVVAQRKRARGRGLTLARAQVLVVVSMLVGIVAALGGM